ncbi:MAG: RidA family protein [Arenicellales bacterium]|nr:RidA family protein [Arenicellales bacterium]
MKTLINPQGTEQNYDDWQMSDSVRVGDTIWISGKVGIDQNGNICEGVEQQTRRAFERVQHSLAEAGATLNDIVELVTYHVSMGDLDTFMQVKSEFIQRDFPAWTAVGVTELYAPEALVEIKATAVVGCGG